MKMKARCQTDISAEPRSSTIKVCHMNYQKHPFFGQHINSERHENHDNENHERHDNENRENRDSENCENRDSEDFENQCNNSKMTNE